MQKEDIMGGGTSGKACCRIDLRPTMKKEHLKVRRDPERRLVWWEHGCAEEGDKRREP